MFTEELRTRRVVIVDKEDSSKELATIEAANGGAGVWIKGPDGSVVAIYNVRNEMAIGFYGPKPKHAMDFAVSLGPDGPVFQFKDEAGEVKFIKLRDLG